MSTKPAENFTYDYLHRELSRTLNSFANVSRSITESYACDDEGNLTRKVNVGHHQYNVSGKPAAWQNGNLTGTQHFAFSYDANGSVLRVVNVAVGTTLDKALATALAVVATRWPESTAENSPPIAVVAVAASSPGPTRPSPLCRVALCYRQ